MISLRSFSWRGVLVFLGFAAALAAWAWSGALFSNQPHTAAELFAYYLEIFQRNLLNYFPAYVLVGLADGLALRGPQRRLALGAALVAGIALAVQVRCAVNMNEIFYAYESVMLPYCTAFPTWRTYLDFPSAWITPMCIAGMVMIFVFTRRRDGELIASLHRVHAEELDSRRQRVEAELDAMQSRVDPDRLIQTLRAIRIQYEARLEEGEAMLDELIGDLRSAARAPAAAAD
jgi:hypothetical protein